MDRDEKGRIRKGSGGRPRGAKNRLTQTFKQLVEGELCRLGPKHLHEWAEANHTEFYKIAARLLPSRAELSGPNGSPLELRPVNTPPAPATYEEWIVQRARAARAIESATEPAQLHCLDNGSGDVRKGIDVDLVELRATLVRALTPS